MRWRRLLLMVVSAFLAYSFTLVIRSSKPPEQSKPEQPREVPTWNDAPSSQPYRPRPFTPRSAHPVAHLARDAKESFDAALKNQSRSLEEAVSEYRRRYGIHPPPLFDKWYHFAKKRNVQMIDDYDTIMDTMLPFWALKPRVIRARVREALGYGENGLIALLIRNGKAAKIEGGPDWQKTVTLDMIEDFAHFLPDIDIAFNVHDEPRVVVPHDELSRMVSLAKDRAMPSALGHNDPQNAFTSASDLDDASRRTPDAKFSRFNEFPHQYTWVPSRLSCSPSSPARSDDDTISDETSQWALGDLGFIYNQTSFSDICSTPSLRHTYGFFNRPNAYKVSHELIPIFSQSKVSSYQDILYPSPWYHYGKTVTDKPAETHQVQYNSTLDPDWDEKNGTFWWRGSTTGGYSRQGGWRRQHRQIFVRNINAADTAQILENHGSDTAPEWQAKDVPRQEYKDLMDIHFSGVGQCDPSDCDAQRAFFEMAMPVDPQDAWKQKYLLDIDGNAFSGRFYSFLHSKSLPFKVSIFREWHQDWLRPWVHYIPLSLKGPEPLEVLRFFDREEEGRALAPRIAEQGREWAGRVLRNSDLEVWMFRLLLEYARVVDDERESIGFGG